MNVKHLDHLNLSVRNFEETAAWYNRVFGFEVVEKGLYRDKPWGVLKVGEAMLCIYEDPDREFWDGEKLGSKRVHGVNHFALQIKNREKWESTVKQESLYVDYGGAWRWPHSTSWYITDPTGYNIEVVLWDNDTIKF